MDISNNELNTAALDKNASESTFENITDETNKDNSIYKEIQYSIYKEYVKNYLIEHNGEKPARQYQQFRSRYKHTLRVLKWLERLMEDRNDINKEALRIATIFHDIGTTPNRNNHAIKGAEIFYKYAIDNNIDDELREQIYYLIYHHSDKELLQSNEIPLELILIMEADLLDEEGAMKIMWDCLASGGQMVEDYEDAYKRIKKYYSNINPMVTEKAINYWNDKKAVVDSFISSLEMDLQTE